MIIYSTYAGSKLFGTMTPTSDIDIRHIAVEPKDMLLGIGDKKLYKQEETGDIVTHGLNHYANMLVKGNPTSIELLYSDEVIYTSKYWKILEESKDLFLSKNIIKSYSGIIKRLMYDFYDWKGRAHLIEKYGYDTKDASHLYRLCWNLYEFKTYKTITPKLTPQALAKERDIKAGKYGRDEVGAILEAAKARAEIIELEHELPEYPNVQKINELLIEIYEQVYW